MWQGPSRGEQAEGRLYISITCLLHQLRQRWGINLGSQIGQLVGISPW